MTNEFGGEGLDDFSSADEELLGDTAVSHDEIIADILETPKKIVMMRFHSLKS